MVAQVSSRRTQWFQSIIMRAELEALIRSEAKGRRIVLDLKNLTLVGQNAIAFLDRCEASGITLKNCPAYIREWIKGQRGES
jgi:hypothetical protein